MSNPLLDLMHRGESGAAGYNAYNRGTYVGADGKEHIRAADRSIDFSRLTVGQVQDLQHAGRSDPDRLFAVGKYQIIPTTMDGGIRALRLDRDTPFTPQLQDRVFSEYLIVGKRPAIHDYITGQNGVTLPQAQHALSLEWASFGDPSRGGRSHYGGANRASITLEQSAAALNQMRADYQRDISAGMSPDAAWRAVTSATPQAQTQTQTAPSQPQTTPSPTQPRPQPQTPAETQRTTFQQTMERMLPPQNGVHAHVTGHFGEGRSARQGVAAHTHGGTDFNYIGGQQAGANRQHPAVHSPVSGTVEIPPNSPFGTVGIRDAQGNLHQVLHLNSQSVRNGQRIEAGDEIGTMGGRGPGGPNQYAQHVHYQVRDPSGRAVNPETFWNNRAIEAPGRTQEGGGARSGGTGNVVGGSGALADGVLKPGERGDDILGLQRSLNRLGVRDANGRALAEDGEFGDRTREAVTGYQRTNGLKVDGEAGRETLESIGNRLPPGRVTAEARIDGPVAAGNDNSLENNALYKAIRSRLPADVPDNVAANVALQAKSHGIDEKNLRDVTAANGNAFVIGTAGLHVKVPLAEPAQSMEQISAQLQPKPGPQPVLTEPQPQVAMGGR